MSDTLFYLALGGLAMIISCFILSIIVVGAAIVGG